MPTRCCRYYAASVSEPGYWAVHRVEERHPLDPRLLFAFPSVFYPPLR